MQLNNSFGGQMVVLLGMAFLTLVCCVTSPKFVNAQLLRSKFAYPSIGQGNALVWVTKDGRIFRENDLDVELVLKGNGIKSGGGHLRTTILRKDPSLSSRTRSRFLVGERWSYGSGCSYKYLWYRVKKIMESREDGSS